MSQDGSRYSAELLFQFRVVQGGRTNKMRICEERTITLRGESPRETMTRMEAYAKRAQHSYENGDGGTVHFEYVGMLDFLHLIPTSDSEEVWYDIRQRLTPMERKRQLIPSKKSLLDRA